MKKITICLIFLVFTYISPVYSWDCFEAHPTINGLAFEHFIARFKEGHFRDKFDRCAIDNQTLFEGGSFEKSVTLDMNVPRKRAQVKENFSRWLQRGGHDADMPQFDMGFKHFYDPVYEPRYLTWMCTDYDEPKKSDFSSEEEYFASLEYRADDFYINREYDEDKIKLKSGILSPKIDAVTWAFEHEDNDHSWKNGKKAYKAAMENNQADFGELNRSQMFGKAFRALGEVMHLMSDMTQPAHTRADSHSMYEPIEGTLDKEIIKEIIGDRHKDADFIPPSEFSVDEEINPKDMMKKVAVFTNANFFSNDTIFDYKKWHFPRIEKRPYPSPQLSKLKHEKGIYYKYFEDVGWVPMAKETGSRFSRVFNDNDKYGRKKPRFNVMPNMTTGQAKVLMPIAIYNCAKLIKEFLPSFRTEFSVERISEGRYRIGGRLIHDVDNDPDWEKIGAIKYNGIAHVQVNGKYVGCSISNGEMAPLTFRLKVGDKLRLVIRAGAIMSFSPSVTVR